MTTQVKVPVIYMTEVATWLANNPNDLKTFIENQADELPNQAGLGGRILGTDGANPVWETFISKFPALLADGYLRNNGTSLSWGFPREVPDPTGVPDGHVVARVSGSTTWTNPSFINQPTFEVIDEQIYTSTNKNVLWEKPATAQPDDLVVIRAWSGGGGGAAAAGYFHTTKRATGGRGGNYVETIRKVSECNAFMLPIVGKGGGPVTATNTSGSGSAVVNGISGERTIFCYRHGNVSHNISLTIANPCVITHTAHGYTNNNIVSLFEIDPVLVDFSNRPFLVEVIDANSYYLLDSSRNGARVSTLGFSPTSITGKAARVVSVLLDIYGGGGGTAFTGATNTAALVAFFDTYMQGYKGAINGYRFDISDYYIAGGVPATYETAFSTTTEEPHPAKPFAGGAGASSTFLDGYTCTFGASGKSVKGGDGATVSGTTNPQIMGVAQEPGGGGAGHAGNSGSWTSGAGAYGRLTVTVIRTTFPMRGRWDYNWQLPDGGIGGTGVL